MIQEQKSLSKWILIVSGLFSLLGLIVASTLIFSPESALQAVDLNAKGADYLIYMWAARQFAVGFIFGFATLKNSSSMLTLSYILFLVINIADAFIGIYHKDSGLIIGAIVMCIISSIMIYFINKQTK